MCALPPDTRARPQPTRHRGPGQISRSHSQISYSTQYSNAHAFPRRQTRATCRASRPANPADSGLCAGPGAPGRTRRASLGAGRWPMVAPGGGV
eukprot:362472-Prymnesium_polylepis.1